MTLVAEPPAMKKSSKRDAGKAGERSLRVTAEAMADRQRDISVSEFFAKNRHLLGFDNPRKALLTAVKEAVDNSLDACEEAGILPDITVVIEDLQPDRPSTSKSSRYRVTIVDNGPGIVRKQVENIFGRLLYGSKFHRLKMSRGQQGIGISAAGMYGLITTGKPMMIQTRPNAHKPAHHIELAMNTKTNRAEVTVDEETDDFPLARLKALTSGTRDLTRSGEFLSVRHYPTGTSVSIELEGRYQKGRGSVDEFLELTAIANPHARITFVPPSRSVQDESDAAELEFASTRKSVKGIASSGEDSVAETTTPTPPPPAEPQTTTETGGVTVFPRTINELPPETKEIQPHPKGIELGILLQMLKEAESEKPKVGSVGSYTLYNFLQDKFSRISAATASGLCDKIGVTSRTKVGDIDHDRAEKLFREFQEGKFPPPPTDCLAPIGVRQLLAGLLKGVRAEFYAASSREPEVYRGRPFQIEAAIAFGGDLPADDSARVIRFANRVPLQFQQSACSSFKAVTETGWKNYSLQQPRSSLPIGPLMIMIHMASVWVPFTSESKEAIADYDEIRKEMKLALMECGRKLGTYLRKRLKMRREGERRDIFERYIGEIAQAVGAITDEDTKKLYQALLEQARKRTAVADHVLDEDGKVVKSRSDGDELSEDDGVLIVKSAAGIDSDAPSTRSVRDAKGGSDLPAALKSTSKSEAARLKVASLAKRADDEPRLIDVDGAKRATVGTRPKTNAGPNRAKQSNSASSKTTGAPGRKAPAKQPSPAVADSNRSVKPKMRLVNGKLVPANDGPGLF